MSKLKNSWIIVIGILFLTFTNTNSSILKFTSVLGTVEPTDEFEIVIGIDVSHQNNITSQDLLNLTSIINSTFSPQEVVFLTEEFSSEDLAAIDVLTVLAPNIAYSEEEIENVEDFIKTGKSLFIASGFRNQTTEPLNDLLSIYGLSFNYENPILSENALARDFTTPTTPLTENISQIICPNRLGISFNESKLTSYQSPSILFYNPILLSNSVEAPSENNTLVSTLEFENGARVLAVGSVDMFNNSFIEPLANDTDIFLDNTDFILNAIKWLGKNTGIMNFHEPWVDKDGLSIEIGDFIFGNVTLVSSHNNSLSQGQIVVTLERTGSTLSSRSMRADPQNSSKYFGWVSTEGLSPGFCDAVFIASRIGYLSVELTAGRIFLEPPFPKVILPNLAIVGLFLASTLLFFSTAFLIRKNIETKE